INGANELLISDEVGLGKTIEAGILIMEELTVDVNSRIVVLCPAFLREKWYQELNEKFLLDSQIYDGKTPIDSMTSIIILPISRIKQYLEIESEFNYSMVIVDEVHYFKNSNSTRYGYIKKLLEQIGDCKRVFMSATPVNNSGNDYRSIERLFASKSEKTNTTKKQAYIYLPERNVEDVYIELTGREQEFYDATDALDPFSGTIYRHIGSSCLYALSRYAYSWSELTSETKEELRNSLEALMDGRGMDEIDEGCFNAMKKLPAPDVDSKITKLKEILMDYEPGCKIVLFSHYIETVKYLHSELSGDFNTGYIYANTISNNIPCRNIKNKFVDAKNWFCNESDKTTILICSDTCREGIDLDMANVLINYDLPFNPSVLEQRIGRIDRMSQKKDMFIYNFHVKGTYDDRLHFILAAKLRFINFYADYGIGNPLNITSEGNHTFDSFIRYFGRQIEGSKNFAVMSNEDYYVASRILRQVGVKLEKKDGIDGLRMQAILLDRLNENQELIEKWFDKGEIKKITEEQLVKKRNELERLLNFPKKIKRSIEFDKETLQIIVEKANKNAQFRKRISMLIKDYTEKLSMMEISGMPMVIGVDDLRAEYSFGIDDTDGFIQSSVIELLRNEGAKVYENN
ncbi:MAG: DEAD/DEAH box helicase, partial [Lachnospiraceae bacterium]|nr:DEAD/DEAH box helicase [Lachnospiraceae bacterium]